MLFYTGNGLSVWLRVLLEEYPIVEYYMLPEENGFTLKHSTKDGDINIDLIGTAP